MLKESHKNDYKEILNTLVIDEYVSHHVAKDDPMKSEQRTLFVI